MNLQSFKGLLFSFVAVTYLLSPFQVHAQTLPTGYTDTVVVDPAASGYKVSSLSTLIESASSWVAWIGGLIVFIYLIWGGIEWITSGGDKSKAEAGRTKITQSIIGFAILAIVFVLYTILINFLGLRTKVDVNGVNLNGGGGGAACVGGISCPGGSCPDGWIYGPDTCAPQASCAQRATEACQNHPAN